MSHDHGWRAACVVTIRIPKFHFDVREKARGVTAMVVGSGALFGFFSLAIRISEPNELRSASQEPNRDERHSERSNNKKPRQTCADEHQARRQKIQQAKQTRESNN